MELSTSIEHNMIDSHLTATGKKEFLEKERVIENTLEDEVNKKVRLSNESETSILGFQQEDLLSNSKDFDKDFEIPVFFDEFMIYDRRKYYSKTQRWIGHIIEIKGTTIIAKLNDLNDPTTHEIAEFEKEEVPFEDRELISIGAGFYWSLGYANDNGQIEKKSLIRFQRTKPWEDSDINNIVDDVDDIYINIKDWN